MGLKSENRHHQAVSAMSLQAPSQHDGPRSAERQSTDDNSSWYGAHAADDP
jgi:hypothetical protein